MTEQSWCALSYHYELCSEALAHRLLEDVYRRDRREAGEECAPVLPSLTVDEAAAYRDRAHMATLLFRKEGAVLRAAFYAVSPKGYTLADWGPKLAESISGK